MPQNFYELVWIFIIYAFIGWCMEVSYAALDRGIFVNRGFLNGPYCPIYGCGVVIVVAALTPIKEHLILLFIGSFLLTSVLEYITGFVLEKVFHNKWWDYSNKPFNIHGYVCLKFSIYWGLACTFVMDVLHPLIYKFITMIPFVAGVVLLSVFMTIFAVDCFITVTTILKFNKKLKVMDEIAESIHRLSDEIGENIYENVSSAVEKSEEFQETHEEFFNKISDTKEKIAEYREETKTRIAQPAEMAKTKIAQSTGTAREKLAEYRENREAYRLEKQHEKEELEKKYQELLRQKNFGFKRLLKAFPDMTSKDQNEMLQKYKKYFNIKKYWDEDKNKQ